MSRAASLAASVGALIGDEGLAATPPAPLRTVQIHAGKAIRPRGARITVHCYELRVSDSDTTDLRYRRGAVAVIASTTSGHGAPLWMRVAAEQIRTAIADATVSTVAEADAGARACRAQRWTRAKATRLQIAHDPAAVEIAAAASDAVALTAISPARWAEYNRKFNALLMRGEAS